jgi:hypothetical protein
LFVDSPGGDFWQPLQGFVVDRLLRDRMISPEDLSLYKFTDRLEEAVAEILRFYRVYHSMRYVRNRLIFRLKEAPSAAKVDSINLEFSDILSAGRFEIGGPLPEERDEPTLAHLPRLVFRFNRRSLGRLRQLIDFLNADEPADPSDAAR